MSQQSAPSPRGGADILCIRFPGVSLRPVCEWNSVGHTGRSQEGPQGREAAAEPGFAGRERLPAGEADGGERIRTSEG